MRYLSLFSGIEAASVAWEPLGWKPMAFSEIEPFPCAVLKERYPDVPNLGDITKIDWSDFLANHGRPDLIVGGSPCQSFSIAGNRTGLAGASGLMYEYIRAIQELRPRWFLWENVPGALSVERGAAFGQLIASLDECGYGLAWRVLDAQFCRVPVWDDSGELVGFVGPVAQRRRRVFLVGCLADGCAAEVLLESEGMSGNPKSSREAREELARAVGRGAGVGGEAGSLTPWDNQSKRIFVPDSVSPTLNSGADTNNTHIQPAVLQPVIGFAQNTRDEVRIQGDGTVSSALSAQPDMKQTTYVMRAVTYVMASGHSHAEIGEDMAPTITARSRKDPPILIDRAAFNQGKNAQYKPHIESTNLCDTLVARGPHAVVYEDSCLDNAVTIYDGSRWVVRRLTPTECERLMGFPDGWTDIGEWVDDKGKTHRPADGPRYKALGNSFAVPVIRWIGERIDETDIWAQATLSSNPRKEDQI